MRVKLEDVCERGSSNLKQSDVAEMSGDYPIYGASGYIGNVDFYHQEKPYIAVVKDGAGIGRTTLHPAKSSIIGTMQYLLPKGNVLPKYLYYVVSYMHLEKYFTGATIPHIYFKDYKNEEFNLDALERQKEIVETLDKCEKIIESRKKELQLVDDLIKARFVEMFGDPVTSLKGRKQVPFSEFMTDIKYGTSQPPQFSEDGEYKFIRATNIKKGRITEENMLRISEAEAAKIQKCKLLGNEIIIVRSGANTGDTCVVTTEYAENYAGYDIIITLDLTKANPVYFNELINTHYMEQIVKPLTARSAQPHLNTKQVQGMPMIVASMDEQNEFAVFVEQVDKSKLMFQKLHQKLNILQQKAGDI